MFSLEFVVKKKSQRIQIPRFYIERPHSNPPFHSKKREGRQSMKIQSSMTLTTQFSESLWKSCVYHKTPLLWCVLCARRTRIRETVDRRRRRNVFVRDLCPLCITHRLDGAVRLRYRWASRRRRPQPPSDGRYARTWCDKMARGNDEFHLFCLLLSPSWLRLTRARLWTRGVGRSTLDRSSITKGLFIITRFLQSIRKEWPRKGNRLGNTRLVVVFDESRGF